MTPSDFKRLRGSMSINDCAAYLQNAPRSVRRYEDGTRAIPGPVRVLMEQLDTQLTAPMSDLQRLGQEFDGTQEPST